MQIKKTNAFSVSETLTTMVIVIVLGSLLIFGMIHNAQRREAVAQLKKAYISFNNAFNMIKMNEGPPETWINRGDDYQKQYMQLFSKYMGIQHIDLPLHLSGLIHYGMNGDTEIYVSKKDLLLGQLNDGTIIRFDNINPACNTVHGNTYALRNVCGEVFVQIKDINGNASLTNSILGKNTFAFYITQDGLVPVGSKGSKEDAQFLCTKSKEVKSSGKSCTAWVLARENLDYLRRPVQW